ncbi:MAG: deoxyguanosinetriphosphate triphosphohydrolase [Actinomycetes bacterium]
MTARAAAGFDFARYDEQDQERLVHEPAKSSHRSPFARDRARVLHSSALRRLAAKTQVVVPWESDFPRTRLTHSLECAQIGRELGQTLGCDPDLVETACLAHDLGHPPFGHNGESALDEVAQSCGGFEGNAQSLRILTRLEAKVLDHDVSAGLNLTRATLDAATKYPWRREPGRPKFGVYDDDLDVFGWIRRSSTGERRCIEAQVMDWADDVAYSVHDFEDAVQAGHLVLDALHDPAEQLVLAALAADRYAPGANEGELVGSLQRLTELPMWPSRFDGSQRAMVELKNATSQLIGRFCSAAEALTRQRHGAGPLRRYEADLEVPHETRLECAMVKAVTAQYVMGRAGAAAGYARQREIVHELTESLRLSSPASLEPAYRERFHAAGDDASRLRVVVDQVASLTDPAALSWHARLTDRAP